MTTRTAMPRRHTMMQEPSVQPKTSNARIRIASQALLRAFEIFMLELMAEHGGANDWVDQSRSPLGRRAHLRAVRGGKLRGVKRGKKVLVRRRDLDAFLEQQGAERREAGAQRQAERSFGSADIAIKALAELGLEMR